MSITKIRKVPSELPNAHLYLDDVEELCNILLDAYRKALANSEPNIHFSIGNDLEMDAIADLQDHGGSTSNFKIEVRRIFFSDQSLFTISYISINGFMSPTVFLGPLNEAEQWSVYSRLKAVFQARQFGLKNSFIELPGWIRWGLFSVVTFLSFPFFEYLQRHSFAYMRHAIISYVILLVLIAFVMFRPSRVSFVRSRERYKFRTENRKSLVKTIFLMLLAAVVGAVVGPVIQHLVSQWWK